VILTNKTDIGYFDTIKGTDLKKMTGIVLPAGGTKGEVIILSFNEMVSVREKVAGTFPQIDGEMTTIQSVAIMADGNVIFSITGNLTTQVKLLVEKIVAVIKRDGLNGAYFPAYGISTEKKFFIVGKEGISSAKALPSSVQNAQPFAVKKEGENTLATGIIFTDGVTNHKTVKGISLSALYNGAWDLAKKVVDTEMPVLFIDRVQDEKTLLTVKGDIIALNLKTGTTKKISVAGITESSAVLRLSAGVCAFIAKKGTEIVTFPQNAPECRAIAQAC